MIMKNTINWGSVILGAALVTGIVATAIFLPPALGATAATAATTGVAGMVADAVAFLQAHTAASLIGAGATGAMAGLMASNMTNQEDITIDLPGGARGR